MYITYLQLGPGEVSGILLGYYITTWLDYNVPIQLTGKTIKTPDPLATTHFFGAWYLEN